MVQQRELPRKMSFIRRFRSDQSGVVIVIFALMLPIIVGFIGLGVETAFWFSEKRSLQSAADAAAIAAAYEVKDGSDTATIESKAVNEAVRNGWTDDGSTISQVPNSGTYSGDTAAREVNLTRSVNLLFSNLLIDGSVTINARAIARASGDSEACVLALDTSASGALSNQGNADITMSGCDIAANSTADDAVNLSGNSSLTVDCGYVVGGTDQGNNVDLTTGCSEIVEGVSAIVDPYASIPDPTIDSCDADHTNVSISSGTLDEGTYCSGINFSGTVELTGGTYIIDRGTFRVNAGATLTAADGVTIILTSSTGANYADVSINGGASVTLAAQSSGNYSGVLFYGDRDGTEGLDATFNGGATMDLTGALYFPQGDVKFTGGVSSGGSCTQIIGLTVTFNGDADLKIDCDGAGLSAIETNVTVGLVE